MEEIVILAYVKSFAVISIIYVNGEYDRFEVVGHNIQMDADD